VSYRLTDSSGSPIALRGVTVKLRRPAYAAEDRTVELAMRGDGAFAAGVTVGDGIWIVEIDADVARTAPYRDVRRIVVSGGRAE
jgi:nitrogen fixation protein FixH